MKKRTLPKDQVCVVYVRFPSSCKEYVYLAAFPVRQGDFVLANGTEVPVIRTAAADERATRYVYPAPSQAERVAKQRRADLIRQLNQISAEEEMLQRFSRLKSPTAKKLLTELKGLRNGQLHS